MNNFEIKVRKIFLNKKPRLYDYFLIDHSILQKKYLKDCRKFLKTLSTNKNKEVKTWTLTKSQKK